MSTKSVSAEKKKLFVLILVQFSRKDRVWNTCIMFLISVWFPILSQIEGSISLFLFISRSLSRWCCVLPAQAIDCIRKDGNQRTRCIFSSLNKKGDTSSLNKKLLYIKWQTFSEQPLALGATAPRNSPVEGQPGIGNAFFSFTF